MDGVTLYTSKTQEVTLLIPPDTIPIERINNAANKKRKRSRLSFSGLQSAGIQVTNSWLERTHRSQSCFCPDGIQKCKFLLFFCQIIQERQRNVGNAEVFCITNVRPL